MEYTVVSVVVLMLLVMVLVIQIQLGTLGKKMDEKDKSIHKQVEELLEEKFKES